MPAVLWPLRPSLKFLFCYQFRMGQCQLGSESCSLGFTIKATKQNVMRTAEWQTILPTHLFPSHPNPTVPLEGYVPILGSSLEAQKAGTNACLLALLPSFEGIIHTKERKPARILEIKNLVKRRKGTVCQQQSTEGSDLHTFDALTSVTEQRPLQTSRCHWLGL